MIGTRPSSNIVAVDFARGTIPVGCDAAFYQRMLQALTTVLSSLEEQVPDGRDLAEIETVVCEDGRSLLTYGYLSGNEGRYAELAANIHGLEYDRANPLAHPDIIDRALRWLATKRTALN
jgi:hypothetical protein